jgi:plastocyanin
MKRLTKLSSVSRILIPIEILVISLLLGCSKSSSSSGTGPGPDEVFIQGMAFNPATLTVPINTTVTWTNKDGVTHNATSTTSAFSSGSLTNGKTYSFTFTTAGTFNYTCTIHPYMTGKVVVQ